MGYSLLQQVLLPSWCEKLLFFSVDASNRSFYPEKPDFRRRLLHADQVRHRLQLGLQGPCLTVSHQPAFFSALHNEMDREGGVLGGSTLGIHHNAGPPAMVVGADRTGIGRFSATFKAPARLRPKPGNALPAWEASGFTRRPRASGQENPFIGRSARKRFRTNLSGRYNNSAFLVVFIFNEERFLDWLESRAHQRKRGKAVWLALVDLERPCRAS